MKIFGHGDGYIEKFLADMLKAKKGQYVSIIPWSVALQNFDARELNSENLKNKLTRN
jgi:hypothetical protein